MAWSGLRQWLPYNSQSPGLASGFLGPLCVVFHRGLQWAFAWHGTGQAPLEGGTSGAAAVTGLLWGEAGVQAADGSEERMPAPVSEGRHAAQRAQPLAGKEMLLDRRQLSPWGHGFGSHPAPCQWLLCPQPWRPRDSSPGARRLGGREGQRRNGTEEAGLLLASGGHSTVSLQRASAPLPRP